MCLIQHVLFFIRNVISVLNASSLQDKLQAENGSFTLLAPTNEAFQDIFDINGNTKSCLEALALNHVIDKVQCSAGPEGNRRSRLLFYNNKVKLAMMELL